MSSSINFSFSSHNVSHSSRRVAFDIGSGGDGGGAGKADEDIFQLLENFKSMDRENREMETAASALEANLELDRRELARVAKEATEVETALAAAVQEADAVL